MTDFNGRARSVLAPKESLRPQARPEPAQATQAPMESMRPQARPEPAQATQAPVANERESVFETLRQMLDEYRNLSANPTLQPPSEDPDRQFYRSGMSEMDRFGGSEQTSDTQVAIPAPEPVTTQEIPSDLGSPMSAAAPDSLLNQQARPIEEVVKTDGPIIADQIQQDVSLQDKGVALPRPKQVGSEEPFSEATSSGKVEGVIKNYEVNGTTRSIIDTSQTAKTDPTLKYPTSPSKVNVQNVVMHYTAAEYRNGVRHYMNSFSLRGPSAAYLVTRDGQIYQTFDPTVKGSHVAGSKKKNPYGIIANSNSVGIEVEATDDAPPTPEQLEASSWLADYLVGNYGAQRVVAHPQANIHKGHVEGYDLVNHWRQRNQLPTLDTSEDAMTRLLTLAPKTSPRPQARPEVD